MWETITMSELWKLLNKETSSVFIEPTFPTRRWGQVTTTIATTDVTAVNKAIQILKDQGIKVRKRIDKETMFKFPKWGKFYKLEKYIEIKNN